MLLGSKKFVISGVLIAVVAVLFFVFAHRTEHVVPSVPPSNSPSASATSSPSLLATSSPTVVSSPDISRNPLTDEACANAARRPFAVMLSGDAEARALSGIAEADMVFEMPVITGSITRFMAVFICRDPIEIGSVRSARHDFIPLAKSLDAIYAHWGGSIFALAKLKEHVIDNIDALPNPTGAFWRKESAPAPHNGFTSMTRLVKAARFLQYRLEGHAPTYSHTAAPSATSVGSGVLDIGYSGTFRVRYVYDAGSQTYARVRGGTDERDRNSGSVVHARNIVVMRALSRQIDEQYNTVTVEGEGDAMVYRNGQEIFGTWKKDAKDAASRLTFVDRQGNEIPFLPGNIWVEIVEPYTDVAWRAE